MKPRPGARLVGLPQAAAELGVPYGLLYQRVKRGDLKAVQPPGLRRIYLDRRDLERAIERWKGKGA